MTATSDKLVVSMDNVLSVRKPLNGVLLLDTLLQTTTNGTSDLVTIEIQSQEVI